MHKIYTQICALDIRATAGRWVVNELELKYGKPTLFDTHTGPHSC